MTAETLVRLTAHGKWHAAPYGDSWNETKTLCGLSFCPNRIERREFERREFDEVDVLWNWQASVCEKCADKVATS